MKFNFAFAVIFLIGVPSALATPAGPVNVWRVDPVNARISRVQAIASQLGLSGSTIESDVSVQVIGPPDASGHPSSSLIFYKASGAIEFAHPAAIPAPQSNPRLLAPGAALARATALLRSAGLMPPNVSTVVLRVDGRSSKGAAFGVWTRVVFTPRLAIAGTRQRPILAPVDHAEITVDLGDKGVLLALDSYWRPARMETSLIPRTPAAAWRDILLKEPKLSRLHTRLTLAQRFFTFNANEAQSFYDPVYVALDRDGHEYAAAAATDFTPRLVDFGPDPGTIVDGSRPVPLAAKVSGGTPPYSYSWELAHGGVLGSGAQLAASLPNGRQAVGLTIRDAHGAGFRVWATFQVVNSPVRPLFGQRPPHRGFSLVPSAWAQGPGLISVDWTTPGVHAVNGPNGTRFDAELVPGRHAARIGNVEHKNNLMIESIFFDQWRYLLEVEIEGGKYQLRSDKCIDDTLAGTGSACYFPAKPFAVPTNAAARATLTSKGDTAMLESRFFVENLPGTFSLHFKYTSEDIANPACAGNIMSKIAVYVTAVIDRSVGGKCPGIIPEVDWGYKPPAGNAMTGNEIVSWCETARPAYDGYQTCNVPGDVLGRIVPEKKYTITDFRAWLFTRVAPLKPGQTMATSLAQDTDSPKLLGGTDGKIDDSHQPAAAKPFTNLFVQILPMQSERSVDVAKPEDTRGLFDNFHVKASPFFGKEKFVDYPSCTSATDATDLAPCMHLHESWLAGKTFSKGQTVLWHIVLDKRGEQDPRGWPSRLVDGDVLYSAARPGVIAARNTNTRQVLWHESQASSKDCAPKGDIDNFSRDCEVFTSPIFFTH